MASGVSTACSVRAALMAAVLATAPALAAKEDPRAAISGQVIDAASGAAIEGAVVIATWWSELPPNPAALALGLMVGGHGSVERRTVYMSETLTDGEGRFTIPAWSATQQWRAGGLTSYSPDITFYAPGHAPATVGLTAWNTGLASPSAPGIRAARQLALYGAGQTPEQYLGRRGTSIAEPLAEEKRVEEMRRFKTALEAEAMEADGPQAPQQSGARQRARAAQRHAREIIDAELRKVYGKDKP